MKICSVCQRCYEDTVTLCPQDNNADLIASRLSTRRIAAKYRLDILLERNATGETYEATNISLNKSFEIRLIPLNLFGHAEQLLERLNNVQTAATINHSNVASVYDYGVSEDNEFYIVTEKIGGQTLQERLKNVGSLSEATAIMIARQAAEGLEAAHSAGVIHRSINSTNIILLPGDDDLPLIKIQNFDFGGISQQIVTTNISAAEPYLDTLRYLSPEQCARQAIDARTDIFSLGVVLYEMLSGQLPFDAPTSTAIVDKIIHEQPKSLNHLRFDVKALLTHILMRSLNKTPALRPQTAANLARHLRHLEYITKQSLAFSQKPVVSALSKGHSVSTVNNISEKVLVAADDSFAEEGQMRITPAPIIETVPAVDLSILTSPVENIEEETVIRFNPVFDSEPILVQRKEVNQVPLASEAILVKRKDVRTSSSAWKRIVLETKNADTVLPEIGTSVANDKEIRTQSATLDSPTNEINSINDFAGQKYKASRRPLMTILGIIALLTTTAILGAAFVNQDWQSQAEQQEASAIPSAPELTSDQQNPVTNDVPVVMTSSNPSAGAVSATVENPPAATSERDNKSQPREETLTNNAKTAKPNTASKNDSAADKSLPVTVATNNQTQLREDGKFSNSQAELNTSLDKWIVATNARDVNQQMNYYAPKMNAYYLARNASLETVRAEKKRVFENASAVNIQASKPEIALSNDGQTAKMRFRKKYVIKNGQQKRSGEVIQELQWVKSRTGWKIVSERDVKVINNP
ncbi:MAG: serine/threonine-protein kinase [Pyrinomonadaceae bacterium]